MKFRIVILKPEMWRRLRRWSIVALWVVGGAGLVAFAFCFSFYLAMRVEMRSTEVVVPDLRSLDLDAASRLVAPLELVLQVDDQRHDPAAPSGQVLQQMPPAGAAVRRGRKIKLILSLGGKVLQVPDLIGHAARAVAIELRQEGFIPGDEARINSLEFASGTIIAQVPAADTPAVLNTRVHRLISDGPPVATWVMPDLSGMTRREAEKWISLSGFRQGAVRRVRMSGRPANTVIGQLPLAGYQVRSRDVVELTVVR